MDNILNLYNAREGTSQRTRLDENLLPENFQIDGRTTGDLVRFAVEFSESLNYYNHDSSITQSWKDFFIKGMNREVQINNCKRKKELNSRKRR